MQRSLTLKINGRSHDLVASEGERLIDVLRDRLGLVGTRYGCGEERCGACMVLVDGVPTYSCTFDAVDAERKDVLTVEGLGSAERLHPVQEAFLRHQAGQCGYCVSGIIMSSVALLSSNPAPSREEIVAALDRHLCRCGTYPRIVAAVQTAAETIRESAG